MTDTFNIQNKIRLIDEGRNPEIYTWESIRELIQMNEIYAGKGQAIRDIFKIDKQ